MILAKLYGPAKYIKGLADAQQEKETREAQQRAQDEIMNKRSLMMQRHQMQIEINSRNGKKVNSHYRKKKKNVQEKAYKERIKHLERARTQLIRPTTSMNRYAPQQIIGIKSPRTLHTENVFRKSAPVKKLQLKPLSEFSKKNQAKLQSRNAKSASRRKEGSSNHKNDMAISSHQET